MSSVNPLCSAQIKGSPISREYISGATLPFPGNRAMLKAQMPCNSTHVITGHPRRWTMINRAQITVFSSVFKANTTEDFTHEDNPCMAHKELDETLNTYCISRIASCGAGGECVSCVPPPPPLSKYNGSITQDHAECRQRYRDTNAPHTVKSTELRCVIYLSH